jgi:hypothetical protein
MKISQSFILKQYSSLLLLLLVKWTVFVVIIFHSESFKLKHWAHSYAAFEEYITNLEASSIESRNQFIKWWQSYSKNQSKLVFDIDLNYDDKTKSEKKLICLGILSKNRLNPYTPIVNHLNKISMSVLTRVKISHRNRLSVIIFNTEMDSTKQCQHLSHLSNLIKVQFVNSSVKIDEAENMRIKEISDYAFALKVMSKSGCEYVMMNEDDTLFKYDWLEIVQLALKNAEKRNKDIFMLKLFTGYKMIDFLWLDYRLCVLIVFSYSSILAFILSMLAKRFSNRKSSPMINFFLAISSFLFCFFLRSLSIAPIKSNSVLEYTTGFGCVSVLYPNDHRLKHLASYLDRTAENYLSGNSTFWLPKDLLVERFREVNNYKEFILEPSIVQHIGMSSSLYNRYLGALGYSKMYKSYSFTDDFKLITFNEKYLL